MTVVPLLNHPSLFRSLRSCFDCRALNLTEALSGLPCAVVARLALALVLVCLPDEEAVGVAVAQDLLALCHAAGVGALVGAGGAWGREITIKYVNK